MSERAQALDAAIADVWQHYRHGSEDAFRDAMRRLTTVAREAPAEGVSPQLDATCEHGTAMDVHCCHCHSGFIFDYQHECPPLPDTADAWREAIEGALGVESDPENHTAEWARELVRVIREHGNAAPVSPVEPTPEPPQDGGNPK